MKTQQITLKLTFFTFLLVSLFSFNAQAQSTVKASDIMKAMKNGEDIKYSNITVTGTLDFTYMDEKAPDLPRRRSWWRNGGDNTVNELIKSKITFENVVFENDVIAYFHDDRSEYTFTADFEENVVFKNCKFERDAMFKYSEFEREASFAGSTFKDESTFKYAEFSRLADFSNTSFDENAIFKYTKFRDGVNLSSARFERSLDIKYTKVRGDFDINNLYVRWDIDSKYTDINGRKFSKNMLDN
ncbi:pentapeptide repeat-containing protein [Roseivirga seohaensis]|uniref:pentapeptide repeat-containing protein n=1 Tax=Roseivirga seohaensis TaxID=1914963 RepID=UPI00069CC7D6|nr:pentapeptide repeat-containing protein [Roseivirga seohaensis]